MATLIFDPEIWLALGLLFVILEMTMDGSMTFFLPLGIGCAFTAAGLAGCSDNPSGALFGLHAMALPVSDDRGGRDSSCGAPETRVS